MTVEVGKVKVIRYIAYEALGTKSDCTGFKRKANSEAPLQLFAK